MANLSFQVLRIANMFRCPKASPFRLQQRQFQSIRSPIRPSPRTGQFKLPCLTFPRRSLSQHSRVTPLPSPHPQPHPSPTPSSPFYGEGPATILIPGILIATCTAIFAYSQYAFQRAQHQDPTPAKLLAENFVLNLDNLRAGRYWTLLTHTITHVSPIHLLVNMIALWSFGRSTIMIFGPATFVALWLSAGTIGGAVPMAWQLYQERQQASHKAASATLWDSFRQPAASPAQGPEIVHYHGAVGASAAILGLIGAQTCFAPLEGMMVFPIPFSVPAYVAVGGFAVFSAAAMQQGWVPEWGHSAHLSGIGIGVLAYVVALRRRFRWMTGPGRWR